MRRLRPVFLIAGTFLLFSCANWLTRQSCEKRDWSKYGFDAGMERRSLAGDEQIEKCRRAGFKVPEDKVQAGFQSGSLNYCQPDVVYESGKKGEIFDPERCESRQAESLSRRHKEGLYLYCAMDNALAAGLSGKKYAGLCPAGMERNFLREYDRGRKKFLTGRIKESQKEIRLMDRQVLGLQHQSADLSFQYGLLPGPRDHEGDAAAADRQRLSGDINRLSAQVHEKKSRQDVLRKQISEDEDEIEEEP